jgi:hypothetical protein
MKPHALELAAERLDMAEVEIFVIERASTYKEFRIAWTKFLLALNATYSKLEQGSKGGGKSEGWWGRLKNRRRTDPLLQYLHQARNTDEHGIVPVSKLVPQQIGIGSIKPGVNNMEFGSINISEKGIFLGPNSKGEIPDVTIYPPYAELVTVIDTKHNNVYEPPTVHLQKTLEDTSPLGVARAGLNFLKSALEDARTLDQH